MMERFASTLLFLVPFLLLGLWAYLDERRRARLRQQWETMAQGEFAYAVYGTYDYTRSEGSMVKHDRTYVMKVTAIYFSDGRSYVARGRLDMPFPTGTPVRLERNGLGGHRILRA